VMRTRSNSLKHREIECNLSVILCLKNRPDCNRLQPVAAE
jgi:hypothetical protein